MKPETIALHGGYGGDPTTKAVAVPIYQTVAYSFDSAAHGAALFDLEVEGYRYTRIGNPTVDVLERRIAELEGGIDALAVASGQTAVYYTMLNLAQAGQNIVSVPQLYGTTHTLFAHILPQLGVRVRLARSDSPAELESLIDADTRALFCETVGNPAGNICDLEAHAAGRVLPRARLHRALRGEGVSRPRPQRLPADHGRGALAFQRLPAAAGDRDGGAAGRAARRERASRRGIPPRRPPDQLGELRRLPRQSPPCTLPEVPRGARLFAHDVRDPRRIRRRHTLLRRARALQAPREPRRCQ